MAIEKHKFDRLLCAPHMGEFKCQVMQATIHEFWFDSRKMADIEIAAFERFGHGRMMIGPNSYGIAEALGAHVVYPKEKLPYIEKAYIKDYMQLKDMQRLEARKHGRIKVFLEAAELLSKEALQMVPVEASVGGPFTIASYLRGVETLLRDCRKKPDEVHQLLRIITDSEKSCIEAMADYGLGFAMADPVSNPELIGPKVFKEFVFPYIQEITEYAFETTGKKVSLHMCGKTYAIWKYLRKLRVNEVSLDNIIDLNRAVEELGDAIPIAGNIPPVEVVMSGTKEEIFRAVKTCMEIGKRAESGFVLSTGCEIPYRTKLQQVDWLMEACRWYSDL